MSNFSNRSDDSKPVVFVISLKDDAERRAEILNTAESIGLSFDWLDAVDGREGRLGQNKDMYGGLCLSSGEIGCSLSHREAYHKIAQSGAAGGFILEDDILLNDNFMRFHSASAQIGARFRGRRFFVHGGSLDKELGVRLLLSKNSRSLPNGIKKVKYAKKSLYGTWCYYISEALAKCILASEPMRSARADAWEERIRAGIVEASFIAHPSVCKHPETTAGTRIGTSYVRSQNGLKMSQRQQSKLFRVLRPYYRIGVGLKSRFLCSLGFGLDRSKENLLKK